MEEDRDRIRLLSDTAVQWTSASNNGEDESEKDKKNDRNIAYYALAGTSKDPFPDPSNYVFPGISRDDLPGSSTSTSMYPYPWKREIETENQDTQSDPNVTEEIPYVPMKPPYIPKKKQRRVRVSSDSSDDEESITESSECRRQFTEEELEYWDHYIPGDSKTEEDALCVSNVPPAAAFVLYVRIARIGAFVGAIASIIGIIVMLATMIVYFTEKESVPFDHGVIIDAGSTHTQAVLYKWLGSKDNGTGNVIQVAECTFDGGIASLPDPTVIINCVKNVTEYIPEEKKGSTPLYLAATAGMRLLNMTDPVLVQLKLLQLNISLQQLGVAVKNVTVISGFQEGTFSWITVNFMMKVLDPMQNTTFFKNPVHWYNTYGSLDMGGASTQIAFSVDPSKNISGPTLPLELYGHKYEVFSREYLCFGAVQAHNRHQALLIKNLNSSEIFEDPCLPAGNKTTINAKILLEDPCTVTEEFKNWLKVEKNRAKNFTFIGTSDYVGCRLGVENVINKTVCEIKGFNTCPEKLTIPNEEMKFMAFSSFYYVTNFLNATDLTLPEFKNTIKYWCNLTWEDVSLFSHDSKIFHHLNQYCFGAIYIQKWLTDIYGFNENYWQNLMFQQEVDGTEVGWALGLMINVTNAIPADKPKIPFFTLNQFILIQVSSWLLIVIGFYLLCNFGCSALLK